MSKRIDWLSHIKQWKVSELSKVEYCRIHRLNKHTFYDKSTQYDQHKRVEKPLVTLPLNMDRNTVSDQPWFRFRIEFPFRLQLILNVNPGVSQ